MQKFLNFLGIRKFTVKDICVLGLFIALTVVFTLHFTIRIGREIEISLNFIPIFIIGALFGPLFGGIVALMADIISAIAYPVGPIIPALCVTAFLSGAVYGLFFYDKFKMSKSFVLRMVLCVLTQFLISIILNSLILFLTYGTKDLNFWIAYRAPVSTIKIFLQAAVIMLSPTYLAIFSKASK